MTTFKPSPTFKLLAALATFSMLASSPGVAQQGEAKTNANGRKDEMASLATTAPRSSNVAVRTVNANSTVWLAPIGHRQPRATDIPVSTSTDSFNFAQEDASVDRKINGICRGC